MIDFNKVLNYQLKDTTGRNRELLYQFINKFGLGLDIVYDSDKLDDVLSECGYQLPDKDLFNEFI